MTRVLSSALLAIATLAALGANASQIPQDPTKPEIAIRCGPSRATILKRVPPAYPPAAVAARISGTVRISVIVDKNGIPKKLRVLSGAPALVNSWLEAVKQWRYKPYELNGVAVPVETEIQIRYVLPAKKLPAATQQK